MRNYVIPRIKRRVFKFFTERNQRKWDAIKAGITEGDMIHTKETRIKIAYCDFKIKIHRIPFLGYCYPKF